MQIDVRAPKAPPMMGTIGSFGIVFPCTKSEASLVGVAPDVGLDEEDSGIENHEEDTGVEDDEEDSIGYDEEGDNTGEFGVVNEVVVVEVRIEVVT
jgi:hypothetical protein